MKFLIKNFIILFVLGSSFVVYANDIFSDLEQKEFEKIIEKWIIDNPEKIRTVLSNLAKKEQKIFFDETFKLLSKNKLDPSIGNPKADIVIYEFFDYNCGYCKSVFYELMSVVNEDKNIKVVMKELPILSKSSDFASRIALAANNQNLYFEFHSLLMENKGRLTEQKVFEIAKNLGLNIDQLKEDAVKDEIDNILNYNKMLANRLQISGTPAFVIGKNIIPGAISKIEFKKLIKNERQKNN